MIKPFSRIVHFLIFFCLFLLSLFSLGQTIAMALGPADVLTGASISGVVKDTATGVGLEGVAITIKQSGTTITTATTDSDGAYVTTITATGEYSVSAVKDGYDNVSPPGLPIAISASSLTATAPDIWMTAASSCADLTLASGWNLISLPFQPAETAIASVLSTIAGSYSIVWSYAASSWKFYDPASSTGNTLTTLEPGKGYWVKTSSDQTLTVCGGAPSSTLNLSAGWNLIGYSGSACTASSTVLANVPGTLQIVWGYTPPSWKFYDPNATTGNTLDQLCPGYGYWIKVQSGGTWTIP
jgi:hypothetical protein